VYGQAGRVIHGCAAGARLGNGSATAGGIGSSRQENESQRRTCVGRGCVLWTERVKNQQEVVVWRRTSWRAGGGLSGGCLPNGQVQARASHTFDSVGRAIDSKSRRRGWRRGCCCGCCAVRCSFLLSCGLTAPARCEIAHRGRKESLRCMYVLRCCGHCLSLTNRRIPACAGPARDGTREKLRARRPPIG
jgi:hypothetical protein